MASLTTRDFEVTISKTIQEQQYEPITVSITTRGECATEDLVAEQDAAYQQLKEKIKAIFNPTASTLPVDLPGFLG